VTNSSFVFNELTRYSKGNDQVFKYCAVKLKLTRCKLQKVVIIASQNRLKQF